MSRAAKMGWEEKQPHKIVLVGKAVKYIAHSLTKLLWALNRLGMRAETKIGLSAHIYRETVVETTVCICLPLWQLLNFNLLSLKLN